MALKVKISERTNEVVGKGTIDGIVPFYYKDQGHRWMVRIGNKWTFKQGSQPAVSLPTVPAARSKMYWAVAEFRNDARVHPEIEANMILEPNKK